MHSWTLVEQTEIVTGFKLGSMLAEQSDLHRRVLAASDMEFWRDSQDSMAPKGILSLSEFRVKVPPGNATTLWKTLIMNTGGKGNIDKLCNKSYLMPLDAESMPKSNFRVYNAEMKCIGCGWELLVPYHSNEVTYVSLAGWYLLLNRREYVEGNNYRYFNRTVEVDGKPEYQAGYCGWQCFVCPDCIQKVRDYFPRSRAGRLLKSSEQLLMRRMEELFKRELPYLQQRELEEKEKDRLRERDRFYMNAMGGGLIVEYVVKEDEAGVYLVKVYDRRLS